MPFTFSHPAIVLPLTYLPKRWFSITGLIIGAIIPDFEYFLRMRVKSNYSHTVDGLLWFDLPFGILLAFVFHNVVRNNLFDNLPVFFKSRFVVFKQFNWNLNFKKNWFIIIISILIGAGSHLIWDSFTHEGGYMVQQISLLTKTVDFIGRAVPILKILQHASTLIGGIVVLTAIYKLPTKKQTPTDINKRYWPILTIVTLTLITFRFLYGLDIEQYGNLIVSCISAVLLSLVLTPLLLAKLK